LLILTTNHIQGIDRALKHRCDVIEIAPCPQELLLGWAQTILKQEDVFLPEPALLELIQLTDHSPRSVLMELEGLVEEVRGRSKVV
jgi:hypothetical protein